MFGTALTSGELRLKCETLNVTFACGTVCQPTHDFLWVYGLFKYLLKPCCDTWLHCRFKWCKRCYCAIWRQLWCVTRFSWRFVFYEVKFCFRLIEIHWLCFYLDQTSVWVSFCHSVLYRQVPGAASGCTRHEIKGTPVLTCHETAYSAL